MLHGEAQLGRVLAHCVLLGLLGFICLPVFATKYPPELKFISILEGRDISLGEVEAVAQDSYGFMWFGGRSGILRFDGYEFKEFNLELDRSDPSQNIKMSQVMDILVDKKDNVWAATKLGLFKFDSNREVFTKLSTENGMAYALSSVPIVHLAESPKGEILIAGYGGLVILDPASNGVNYLVHNPSDPRSILDNFINSIHVDTKYVWVGTRYGASRIDWETKKAKKFIMVPPDQASKSSGLSDKPNLLRIDGTLNTNQHNFKYNLADSEVEDVGEIHIKINNVSAEAWRVQVMHELPLEKDKQYTFCYDAKSESPREIELSVDTGYEGYKSLSGRSLRIKTADYYQTFRHTFNSTGTDSSSRIAFNLALSEYNIWLDNIGVYEGDRCGDPYFGAPEDRVPDKTRRKLIEENYVHVIKSDKYGNTWLGTNNGAIKIDAKTEAMKHYPFSSDNKNVSFAKVIHDIYSDSTGLLWFGSEDVGIGLYKYETDEFISYHASNGRGGANEASIREIFEDAASDMWLGTFPSGISFYDRSSTAKMVFTASGNRDDGSILDNNVRGIQEDKRGDIWFGTLAGVHFWDRKKDTFSYYTPEQGSISSGAIQALLLDGDGDVWVGTWGSGISLLEKGAKAFKQIPFDGEKIVSGGEVSSSLPANSVWSIFDAGEGLIWIGTHSRGLYQYDKTKKTFKAYLHDESDETSISNNLVWSILEDSQKNLWVGTAWGLNRMDPKTKKFTRFYADENIQGSLSNNNALGLFEDSQGFIWVATDYGANRFNPKTERFDLFTMRDGLSDNAVKGFTEDQDARIWITSLNGYSIYEPSTNSLKGFTKENGVKIGGFNFQAAILSARGEIILGGGEGLRVYNVKEMKGNTYRPPIVLTDMQLFTTSVQVGGADGLLQKALNLTEEVVLDYKKTMIGFSFASLNYRDSLSNEYAYKLEGFDDDWRKVGGSRSAVYTNLDAGKYSFLVKGSNNDGLWSEKPKSISIVQLPPPWLTIWAKLAYAAVILFAIYRYVLYQRRKREAIIKQNILLEEKVEERTVELRRKNNDIQAMLSNMSQGLFTITENLSVHDEYSRYLEDIFEQRDIGQRNAVELMFFSSTLSPDKVSEVEVVLISIVGENPMNFDFNAHLLPREYDVNINSKLKHLALQWNPIIEGEIVDKVMVSIRDVTDLKRIEGEARVQQRELDMISQLIKLSDAQFSDFEENVSKQIKASEALLYNSVRSSAPGDAAAVESLFRYMHTIKGASRTYNLTNLSAAAHNAESSYNELKLAGGFDDYPLAEELEEVKAVLKEYKHVYLNVLDRGKGQAGGSSFGGLGDAGIQKIRAGVERVMAQYSTLSEISEISGAFMGVIDEAMSLTLSQALADLIASLPSIAEELGKPAPIIELNDGGLRVKPNGVGLLRNIFSHLLRNSLDHGIEPAALRQQNGKPENGLIKINVNNENNRLTIQVCDDGGGLNLSALREKGVQQGLLREVDKPESTEIANLIFNSGVSTKNTVTDISGRGVGLDAVKAFLNEQGADIELKISRVASKPGFVAVIFVIYLGENSDFIWVQND